MFLLILFCFRRFFYKYIGQLICFISFIGYVQYVDEVEFLEVFKYWCLCLFVFIKELYIDFGVSNGCVQEFEFGVEYFVFVGVEFKGV